MTTASLLYACPHCHSHLEVTADRLSCASCRKRFPIVDGIPDFLERDLAASDNPVFRSMARLDRFASLYESRLWYSLVLNLYGGLGSSSLRRLVAFVSNAVGSVHGLVLDVACGPATFGRRVAGSSRSVYGIDVSMGMLAQGNQYLAREGLSSAMHLARAGVEALPFGADLFDAVLCCGSLHLFPDAGRALLEMARTMKGGAPLAVVTFAAGGGGLLRSRPISQRLETRGLHAFEHGELQGLLDDAGFGEFEPHSSGSVLTFTARRTRP